MDLWMDRIHSDCSSGVLFSSVEWAHLDGPPFSLRLPVIFGGSPCSCRGIIVNPHQVDAVPDQLSHQ
jgi:hypothetical protein